MCGRVIREQYKVKIVGHVRGASVEGGVGPGEIGTVYPERERERRKGLFGSFFWFLVSCEKINEKMKMLLVGLVES